MSANESEVLQANKRVANRPWVAVVVALFTALLAAGLWYYSTSVIEQRARDRFLYRVDMAERDLVGRMNDFQQVLRGAQGLYAASETVSRREWRTYVEALQLDSYLPGVQSMAFSLVVRAEERRAHESSMRAQGFPEYSIFPADSPFPMSVVVLYIEPFAGRNPRAVGYDMYHEAVRREAMERARDTGKPALSGKLRLVFEEAPDIQPGFLLYLPIYRNGWPTSTVDERRQALFGFINSAFRANDLLTTLLRGRHTDVELDLFDDSPSHEDLLYSSDLALRVPRHIEVPHTESEMEGAVLAEKIRHAIAEGTFPYAGKVTVSIGVSRSCLDDVSEMDIFRRADQALYQAKEQGRDRVCTAFPKAFTLASV